MDVLEAKADLATVLSEFHPVTYMPSGVTPPVVVIRDGNPYLEPGRTFGDYTLNLSVLVIGAAATDEESSRDVDQKVMDILPLLEGTWSIDQITPELFEGDGYLYPAVSIDIHNQVNF